MEGILGLVINSAFIEVYVAYGIAVAFALVSDVEAVVVDTGLAVSAFLSNQEIGKGFVFVSVGLVILNLSFVFEIVDFKSVGEIGVKGSVVYGLMVV